MEKIPVAILGATGIVGQKFVELLATHPWFEIVALTASNRSVGRCYQDVVNWSIPSFLPKKIAEMPILPCLPNLPCNVVFSSLHSTVAGKIERDFAKQGYLVISNCSYHRMDPHVPLLIPEVNSDHLRLLLHRQLYQGMIVTNPNCSVIGISMALKPLIDHWGVESVNVVTLQSLSGAGYPGISSLDILDNIIPHISEEEEKIETEPLKILGNYTKGKVIPYPFNLSAQCMRVAVTEGHLACISVKFKQKAKKEEMIEAWKAFGIEPQTLKLPTAPKNPIIYFEEKEFPQPKRHRYLEKGMAISIGRLRRCHSFDWKFVVLLNNTVRGAAGCAVLNAELMIQKKLFHSEASSTFAGSTK